MRMIWAVRERPDRVELSPRCTQPALRHGSMRVLCSLENDLFAIGRENMKYEEQIGVGCRGGDEQLGAHGAGDLDRLRERCSTKSEARTRCIVVEYNGTRIC